MLKKYISKEGKGMTIYSKPKIVVLKLKEDVITTSGNDNVGAGRSDWTGWSNENDGGVWEE